MRSRTHGSRRRGRGWRGRRRGRRIHENTLGGWYYRRWRRSFIRRRRAYLVAKPFLSRCQSRLIRKSRQTGMDVVRHVPWECQAWEDAQRREQGILRHTAKSGYSSLGADMTSQIDKTGDGTTGRRAGRRECYSDEKGGRSEDRGLDEEAGDGRRADSYGDS